MVPHESVLDLIGNTPVVDVSVLSPNPRVRLIAKLEGQNPFGSVKDRIAKSMIDQAIKDGKLMPGQRIMEPSSGNTGIALAAIAAFRLSVGEATMIGATFIFQLVGAQLAPDRTVFQYVMIGVFVAATVYLVAVSPSRRQGIMSIPRRVRESLSLGA